MTTPLQRARLYTALTLAVLLLLVPVITLFGVCEYVTATLPFCTEQRYPLVAAIAIVGLVVCLIATTMRAVALRKNKAE